MIKIEDISNEANNFAVIMAFADTKSEVPANVLTTSVDIEGFPNELKIASASVFHTADGDVGFVKSDGSVSWV